MFRYFGIFSALSCALLFVAPLQAPPPKPDAGEVVISQIYTGGGTPGAAFQNSFVELFNRSNATRDLSGVPITFTSATGAFSFSIAFVSSRGLTIGPGQHFLIQFGTAGPNGNPLPSPDAIVAQRCGLLRPMEMTSRNSHMFDAVSVLRLYVAKRSRRRAGR